MRTGLIAKKLGMSALYSENGERFPVTILKVEECQVVGVKTPDVDGYCAVKLAYGEVKNENKLKKPLRGFFKKNNFDAKSKVVEFRVRPDALLQIGDVLSPNHFIEGQKIDVKGVSVGKGFAGVMKRHNFSGLEASHGVSVSHRSGGSTGQCQDPGRVFKNKKMAGRLGGVSKTIQNLQVLKVDSEKGLIFVKGGVPGHKGSYIKMTDAIKFPLNVSAPFPAAVIGADSKDDVKEVSNED